MSCLRIDNVSKTYGTLQTVRGVSLRIVPGERVALLGHNGAGKTTLMRMILGLTAITSGTIDVLGHAPGSRAAHALTGFLPESVAFHGALSGREQLHHFARLKSVPVAQADALLERVGLDHAADRKIHTYSKGMRQRVGLAQALLGRPRLALLDEPTSGLDPISRHEFYDIIDELAAGGTAVLLSSHALTELETRTDRIAILSKGRLLADGSLADLRRQAHLPVRIQVTACRESAENIARTLGGRRINGASVLLSCPQEEKLALLERVTGFGEAVRDVDIIPASLEELYRHYSAPEGGGETK